MRDVLIAAEAAWIRNEVRSVLDGPDVTIREVHHGSLVLAEVQRKVPSIVICDQHLSNMGSVAITFDLRLEQSGGRLPRVPVLLLLDRRADVFLARRADADGWLVKPLDPMRIRRAVSSVIEGGTYFDDSYEPPTVPATPAATT